MRSALVRAAACVCRARSRCLAPACRLRWATLFAGARRVSAKPGARSDPAVPPRCSTSRRARVYVPTSRSPSLEDSPLARIARWPSWKTGASFVRRPTRNAREERALWEPRVPRVYGARRERSRTEAHAGRLFSPVGGPPRHQGTEARAFGWMWAPSWRWPLASTADWDRPSFAARSCSGQLFSALRRAARRAFVFILYSPRRIRI